MIKYIIIYLFVGLNILMSFEVNTHQALTRCAIADSCGNGKAENLTNFVNHSGLNTLSQVYANEYFEGYGGWLPRCTW